MKKLSALLLALVLAATLCFGAMAEEINYVGTWTLTVLRMGEQSMDPASLGMDMSVVLNEDSTCTLTTMGVTETGTWAAVEGGVALTDAAGTTDTLTYVDGTLVMSAEGIEMVLTPGAAESQYAEILSGLTIENFAGNWVLEHVETTYGVYSVEDLGAEMTVTIVGADADIVMVTTSGTMNFKALCETEEADGLPDGTGMMFLLYDDGQLVWYEYDSTEGQECEYFYCFTNTAE